jgi:hypothetical protein
MSLRMKRLDATFIRIFDEDGDELGDVESSAENGIIFIPEPKVELSETQMFEIYGFMRTL